MKRLLLIIIFLAICPSIFGQLYHPGERLSYRISYKAKMFPNTEVGSVEIKTKSDKVDGRECFLVEAEGKTLPTYRWFYNMLDRYKVWVDAESLRPVRYVNDIKQNDYTFQSEYKYDWVQDSVRTSWSSRGGERKYKTMPLSQESMDAISIFFNLRTAAADEFKEDEAAAIEMVLEDTIRHLQYKYLGREVKKIRNMGQFNTLKFSCQLGTSEGFTFTDGSSFTIWISDDENKIPLYISSPVRVGSVNAYISGYKGLKYPLTSKKK